MLVGLWTVQHDFLQEGQQMDSFQQMWQSSRITPFAWYYYLTLCCGVFHLVALSMVANKSYRFFGEYFVIVAFSIVAIEFAAQDIQEKWRRRAAWAESHSQRMTLSQHTAVRSDGANIDFGPIVSGFKAFLMLSAVSAVLRFLRRSTAESSTVTMAEDESRVATAQAASIETGVHYSDRV